MSLPAASAACATSLNYLDDSSELSSSVEELIESLTQIQESEKDFINSSECLNETDPYLSESSISLDSSCIYEEDNEEIAYMETDLPALSLHLAPSSSDSNPNGFTEHTLCRRSESSQMIERAGQLSVYFSPTDSSDELF